MKYLFIDTETTGLPKNWKAPVSEVDNWPRIIQVAWIVTDEYGQLQSEKDYLIYPEGFSIPSNASEVHGITDEIAKKNGVNLKTVLLELNGYISSASYVIAHNIDFDLNVIGAEFQRCNLKTVLFEKKKICTMLLSTDYCALANKYTEFSYNWPTLSELHYKLFEEVITESHNALIDIKATLRCFWKLIENKIIVFRNGEAVSSFIAQRIDFLDNHHKLQERIKSKDFIGTERFINIWHELTYEWKELIHQEHPLIPLKDTINEEEALRLKFYFNTIHILETGDKITNLDPLKYFINLEFLLVGIRERLIKLNQLNL
jgi:DNA polymerase-3 subunit epsilon